MVKKTFEEILRERKKTKGSGNIQLVPDIRAQNYDAISKSLLDVDSPYDPYSKSVKTTSQTTPIKETVAATTSVLSDVEARTMAEQNVIKQYGTYEQFVNNSHKNTGRTVSANTKKISESMSKAVYEKLITDEMGKLSSNSEFYGLTNESYQAYLDNFKQTASEKKQKDWLNKQKSNLEILKDARIRNKVETLVYRDEADFLFSTKYDYDKVEKDLKKLGYSEEDIESLIDTVKRENNAAINADVEERTEKLAQTLPGQIFGEVLGVGSTLLAPVSFIINTGYNGYNALKEKITGEYEPADTNNVAYQIADFKTDLRGALRERVTEGNSDSTANKAKGMVFDAVTALFDSTVLLAGGGQKAAAVIQGGNAAANTSKETLERTGSNEQAFHTGVLAGGVEAVTEKASLGNLWEIAQQSGNKLTRSTLVDIIMQAGIEGTEEMSAEALNTIIDQAINEKDSNYELNVQRYMDEGYEEDEAREKAFTDTLKQIGEAGAVGAISGGIGGGIAGTVARSGNKEKITYSENEQKVIDKVVQEEIAEQEADGTKLTKKQKKDIEAEVKQKIQKGYIDIDTIESALGGETYDSYKNLSKEMEEYSTLNKMKQMEMTGEQVDRLAELKEKNKTASYESETKRLKEQLSKEVSDMTLNDRFLQESYNEKSRRGQAFQADTSTYDEKMQDTVQKAIDSGILNNTNRTHEFVDMIAKISADKGVSFDFTDNARLKESGLALEGITVNGYVKDGTVTLNINSAKALNSVVGHEITHVLEGTEHYAALAEAVKRYATSKGEYRSRYDAIAKLYKNVKDADIENELTADLIGDYLFTDEKFVRQLSSDNRNVFQKIYDEIKYLVKTVTSGSKEAKQLEKVKKVFDAAYRDSSKAEAKDNVQFSLVGTDENGIEIYETSEDTKKLSYAERKAKLVDFMKNEYAGRTAKFTKNGQVYYAMYDRAGVYKGIHGDKKSSPKGYKAKINIGADGNYIELAENALYQKTSAEQGKNSKYHLNAKTWDYYVKTIQSDGNYYDVLINVKDTGNEQYVYDITLNEADLLPDQLRSYTGSSPASNSSIPKTKENATKNAKKSIGDFTVDSQGNELSVEQQKYFKDSQVRDENGALRVVYHGTNAEFTVFDNMRQGENYGDAASGFFFFTSKKANYPNSASDYAELHTKRKGGNSKIYECYIKMNNPLRLDSRGYYDTVSYYDANNEEIYDKYFNGHYDGVIIENSDKSSDDGVLYLVDNSAQIKSVDNHNPTDNPDINLSLSNQSQDIVPIGNWNVKGKDISLEGIPIRQDIAPMHETKGSSLEGIPIRQDIKPAQGEDVKDNDIATLPPEWNIPISEDLTVGPFSPPEGWKSETSQKSVVGDAGQTVETKVEESDGSKLSYKNATKVENLEAALWEYQYSRDEMAKSFEREISAKWQQYNSLKRLDTKKAEKILTQIDALKFRKNESEARFNSKIQWAEKRIKSIRDSETSSFNRQEYHKSLIDNIKAKYEERGYDFDEVLNKAKNKWTPASVDNTPQRFMEKTLGYKEGQILSDLTVNQTAQNETKAIQWLNSYTDRKNGFLAQISKQYDIKPRSKESAAAQMYGEGFYVNKAGDYVEYTDVELAKDFPDPEKQRNIKALAKDPRIRQVYDETLDQINESRKRNGYSEIPRRKDYFLHFHVMEDAFSRLGIPFNPNDIQAKDLPTDINGVTADLKPGQPYFTSSMQRKGNRTTYDLLGGLERYLDSAKNQIFHIDDIQTLRALRNYIADTYGQAKGLESLDNMSEEEAAHRIEQVYSSHLSTFAKFLNEQANTLAGKTALMDRALEGIIGRRGLTFLDDVKKQVSSNLMGFNLRSALTNFDSAVKGFAKGKKSSAIKAMAQTIANKISSINGKTFDDFTQINPLCIRRKGADKFVRTPYEKARDVGFVFAGLIDDISTEFIARTKYNELTQKGMDKFQAHIEADKWASRILGDRSYGQQPQLYNSKMLGLITQFQLEVRNNLDSMFYDTIQEAKVSNEEIQNKLHRNSKIAVKVTSTLVQLAFFSHLFGKAMESLVGYNPTMDMVEVLAIMFGFDDDEESEDTILDNVQQGFMELLEDMPYSSLVLDGGRIPTSSALPIREIINGTDQYGNEKAWIQTAAEALPYYILPTGYGQTKTSIQGIKMFDDDLPIAGSYTNNDIFDFLDPENADKEKKLRFSVDDDIPTRVQAAVFGQYANENARQYFDEGRTPLDAKKTQELVDLDIPISDYWKIQDGMKGKTKLEEKADYISGLDLPIAKKNILINNQTTRKEKIDLTDYDLYDSLDEFDFANEHPEKYKIATAIGGYEKYKKYTDGMKSLKADKDEDGEPISGSGKNRVILYLDNLDIAYGDKLILFKQQFSDDDTYNREIVDYLDKRTDISYSDKETILKELGFTVTSDGTVRW